ncbi:hypothetical protein Zmor_011047 [Zophobas morio]|uniref:Envelope fusion protein n=1 Tax=Zophobas morio TaxID=2755281 RepID=A0AA38ILD1_9CUCU|nr:hypothetical protein Zmor_011047 [Zophobas morio]
MITISQEILRILEEIETAISFAKLNTLHNSIIDPKDLLNELKIVENKLDKKSLAYEANEANLLTYERIIQIKAYQKDLHITFIFEIPLTEPHNYNFYQLYPFPIQHDSKTYQIIIPSHKYLYLNELYFSLNDDKCNEVTPGDYICNLPQTSKISKEAPCEIQLLKFSKNYQQCKIIKVNLKNTKIRKIDKNQWIGIFPIEQPATSTCGQQEEHLSVKGSYVITVPDGCKLRINSTTLQSYQNPEFKKQSIQTPKLEISSNIPLKEEIWKQEPLQLETVDLADIDPIYHRMHEIQQDLQKEDHGYVTYSTNIWTILICIFFIVTVIFFIWHKCIKPRIHRYRSRWLSGSPPEDF